MKNIVNKILFVLFTFSICKFAFANTNNDTFSIYVTNSTPYAITLSNSNYNVTPIDYVSKIVTAGVQQLKVATVKMNNGQFNISFFAHSGTEEMSYINTPLITYIVDSTKLSLQFEPAIIEVEGHKYSVTVQSAEMIDKNVNSIIMIVNNA